MADTAFVTQYRNEFVRGFEQRETILRELVTTEAVFNGATAVFLVADSGGAAAVTRGVNGLIPARANNLTQASCSLSEWHDLVRMTDFNIFASQGNQRAIMQLETMAVVNRKIDNQIFTELDAATVSIGATGTIPNFSLVQNGIVKLANAAVPYDSNIALVCQPSFLAYLEQAPEFAHAQYVDIKPLGSGNASASWRDKPVSYRWRNLIIVMHPNLPGRGTSSEHSYIFHKSAIGHAMDTAGMENMVGYNEEQDYSWARASAFMGAKTLQSAGIVEVIHDGSAYA